MSVFRCEYSSSTVAMNPYVRLDQVLSQQENNFFFVGVRPTEKMVFHRHVPDR